MSLCDTPLTPACEQELSRLIALVPDAEWIALAAIEPLFQAGGFRAGNPAAVRLRVQQLAKGKHALPESIRPLLARRSPPHALTRLLSPEALAENRHLLASVLSPPVFLVALLLDPRKDLRDKAADWLTSERPFLPTDPHEALARLRETFGSLTSLLGTPLAPDGTVTREIWHVQKERLELRLRDLAEQNRKLKGSEDRLSGLKRQLKTTEEKLQAVSEKAAAADAALRQKSQRCDALEADLSREIARRDERLAAALELALAKEFHGWLAQARAVEAAAGDPEPAADLLARAEAALKRQAEIDRHSGNRQTLADRLARVDAAHETAASALRQALRQAPELKLVEAELALEARRLRELLEPDAPSTPLEETLLTRLHAAPDNDLPRLRDLPELIESLRLLDRAALQRLREAFRKRLAALQAVGVPPDPRTDERQDSTSRLGRALAGRIPALLLIDGHNAIFGLPSRYNPPRGGALSETDKRKKLTDDIVRLTGPSPAVRAWIVFDGPTRHDTQAAPNVRVTYSGGTGEHRADTVLVENIRFFKSTSPETPVLLVSNDQDLCQAARRLGAETVAVLDLGAFL